MKTLVIHPKDSSTDFLEYVYAPLSNITVVRDCNISKEKLKELIRQHDRILMMGHGTPYGLLNPQKYGLLIDDTFAELFRDKETVSIWCNSDAYFEYHHLPGFHTGMIISECGEQQYVLGDVYLDKDEQLENMIQFAKILSKCINMDARGMQKYVLDHYTGTDPVTRFNRENIIVTA